MKSCPFCSYDKHHLIAEDEYCIALVDSYPVSNHHVLIVPRTHTGSYFDLSYIEKAHMTVMLERVRDRILKVDPTVKAFTIGINDGPVAGQTIPHCHMHLIPRREGDVDDPRGGVRGVIPSKRTYERVE